MSIISYQIVYERPVSEKEDSGTIDVKAKVLDKFRNSTLTGQGIPVAYDSYLVRNLDDNQVVSIHPASIKTVEN